MNQLISFRPEAQKHEFLEGNPVRILLYGKQAGAQGFELGRLIDAALPDGKREVYQDIQSLVKSLREPVEEKNIAVLLPADWKDLQDLLSIQHLLRDIPLILLIADPNKETTVMAHRLRPRFVGPALGDYGTVIQVLKKIARSQSEKG
ncbi:MAG: hypothetical protein ACM3N7_13375 [Planctomycetaceae bacterium]